MKIHQKNPKIKKRMSTWSKRTEHKVAAKDGGVHAPKKPNEHIENIKRGMGIIGSGLAKLGSEENREKMAKLGKNAGKMTREKQFTGLGTTRKPKKSRGIFDF